jgi:CheY-like chemotaxis protein
VARILIVDDEPDVRELFNITLKMAGHVTDTAKHGLEAVDKLASDIPELIVLDLMMPHLDGYGLLNHIRNEMSTKPIRVLVATAKVLEDSDQEKLGSWPVVGVLNKGELDIGQMVLIVTNALTRNPLKDGGVVAAAAASGAKEDAASPAAKEGTPAPTAAPKEGVPAPAAAPAPAAKEGSAAPTAAKESVPAPAPKEGTPAPATKEGTPSPVTKDGTSTPTTKDGA